MWDEMYGGHFQSFWKNSHTVKQPWCNPAALLALQKIQLCKEAALALGPCNFQAKMAKMIELFSAQPCSRCLPWCDLYKCQIEFIAKMLAPQPVP